jgi:ribonucleoside-diphosphate reductase beta chain
MTDILNRKKLFNVDGNDDQEHQELINGNSTGICNLNNVKYKWVPGLYNKMLGNFWIPEKVNLQKDKITIKELTPEEDESVKNTLSFLIFLDSIQVNNLPNIQGHITDPAVNNLLVLQQFQEVIHSQSYQYILESLYPNFQRDEIYNKWRTNDLLKNRNSFVADQYEDFVAEPNTETFKKVLLANFCLESIYFYSGFNLFDQLANRKKLIQTSKVIDYIRRDENTHVALFLNLMRETMDIRKEEDLIYSTIDRAVNEEIQWAHSTYGDNIMGVSKDSSLKHIKYLANMRLKAMGLGNLYDGFDENPYRHLEEKGRENFFEVGAVTEYDRSESMPGWDQF